MKQVSAGLLLVCFAAACGGRVDGPATGVPPVGTPAATATQASPPPATPNAPSCGPTPLYLCASCVSPDGTTYGSGDPICTAGTWGCTPTAELPACPGGPTAPPPDAGPVPEEGGTVISSEAGACSMVGTWNVTANTYYGTDASFEFNADGTFVGGPRGAMLPSGAIYAGSWTLAGDMLTIGSTSGFRCNMGTTVEQVSFSPACDVATLQDVGDDCTGGRDYFDGSVLTRQ